MTDRTKVPHAATRRGRRTSKKLTVRPAGDRGRRRTPRGGKPFADGTEDVAIGAMSLMRERRRHPRVPVSWPVRVWVDDEALLGHAEDASRHGLWVTVPLTTSLKLGKTCWIDILSEELGSFTVAGEVRYVSGRRVGLETTRPVPIDED
jgi:hypothetical protein